MFVGSNIRSQKEKQIATYFSYDRVQWPIDLIGGITSVSLTSQLIKIMEIMSECRIFSKDDDGMSWEYAVFWTYIKWKNTIVTFWTCENHRA
jgi:hypothetical protein